MISLRMRFLVYGSCLLAGALLAPSMTFADADDRPPSRVVNFADLNLNSRAGVEILYHRLASAAQAVCEPIKRPDSLIPSAVGLACMRGALLTAVHSVNSPSLTAYYDERETRTTQHRLLLSAVNRVGVDR
jgi:UrcA family protein